MKNIDAYYLIKSFSERIFEEYSVKGKWELFQTLLLSDKGNPIDFRKAKNTTCDCNKDGKSREYEAKERLDEILRKSRK